MSKRKTGALRKKDPRFTNFETNYYEDTNKTFYTKPKETKTVTQGLTYTSYATFGLGGLGCLLLVFANLAKLYIKK